MSKLAVKVFKRKDIEVPIHHTSESQIDDLPDNPVKAERRSHRELVNTVTNWVTERRERRNREDIEGLRRIFGDSIPTLKEA